MDALVERDLFEVVDNSYSNFVVPAAVLIRRRKRKKEAKSLGLKNLKEFREYQKKENELEGKFPVSKDIEAVKFYLAELKKLQSEYRKNIQQSKNDKERRMFNALLTFVNDFIVEKEFDLQALENKGKLPEEAINEVIATPVPTKPPTTSPGGAGVIGRPIGQPEAKPEDIVEGEKDPNDPNANVTDSKKGINKYLIFGAIGVVAVILYMKFKK